MGRRTGDQDFASAYYRATANPLVLAARNVRLAWYVAQTFLRWITPGRKIRRRFAEARRYGKQFLVDTAALRPADDGMPLGYAVPPVSGNLINGLGESESRLATPVFHSTGRGGARQPLAWARLDAVFNMLASPRALLEVLRTLFQRRLYVGRVARRTTPFDDPSTAAAWVKALARDLGASAVGITTMDRNACYAGYPVPSLPMAISVAMPMRRGELEGVPDERSAAETMRTYRLVSRLAIRLAAAIRARGWEAKAFADGEYLLQIPLALRAGLGELGKHGSLITLDHGSNVRLAAVLTTLPMTVDAPVDFGVQDLCARCRRCTLDCPPGAIGDRPAMVRGVEKWYVDFDRCIPWFAATEGCGICIQTCPWSTPGRGPGLRDLLLARRATPHGGPGRTDLELPERP